MEGVIANYRRGRHTMHGNHAIIEVPGYEDRKKAAVLIGTRVVWKSPAEKTIYGSVVDVHGNKGAVRAIFSRGLPGQAMGKKIELIEKSK